MAWRMVLAALMVPVLVLIGVALLVSAIAKLPLSALTGGGRGEDRPNRVRRAEAR